MKKLMILAGLVSFIFIFSSPALAIKLELNPSSLKQAAVLRTRAYENLGEWKEAAKEWKTLVIKYPADENLRFEYGSFLDRKGDWIKALKVFDQILRNPRRRDIAEKTYEIRKSIRQRRSNVIGMEAKRTELGTGKNFGGRTWAWYSGDPKWMVGIVGGSIRAEDPSVLLQSDFDDRVDEYGLDAYFYPTTDWEFRTYGRLYSGSLTERRGWGGSAKYRRQKGGSAKFELDINKSWTQPVSAIINQGLYDRAAVTLNLPTGNPWSVSVQGQIRDFEIFRNLPFGRERKGSINIGRRILETPYGSNYLIRFATLTAGYERLVAKQNRALAQFASIQDAASTFTTGFLLHFPIGHSGSLEVTGFVGHDDTRGLKIQNGDLMGTSIELDYDITPWVTMHADGQYATESSALEQGGRFRQVRSYLTLYY
ncbi:MAG: bacterial transcriptional activator domain-containing protein [Candidatus Lindowbacteria bacterium]|nr:bacterial transcriptional activator domain-containing protein [Candidatus Lindowbacteria bacterium]